jgi:hypothetical protein
MIHILRVIGNVSSSLFSKFEFPRVIEVVGWTTNILKSTTISVVKELRSLPASDD